jgi:hypothetical protein
MRPIHYGANDNPVQRMLRELFDAAAAMSLAVIDQLDAEEEMVRFLHASKAHPEERAFVVGLFTQSFSDSFILKWEPWKFLQFCMHDLRWPEIREFILAKKEEDFQKRGAAASSVWNSILEAFENKWGNDWPEFFHEFRPSQHSPPKKLGIDC